MLPSLDPARVRAAHRRLGVALGISAALHVACAGLWFGLSAPAAARLPEPLAITDYLTDVPPPPALPPVVALPDEVFDEQNNAGAPSGGGTDVPVDTPPPSDGETPSVQPSTGPAGAERLSTTETVRQPTGPLTASAQAAAAPPPPGAPTSGPPPVGAPGGTGSTSGGAQAGSGTGTGGGTGSGTGGPGGGGEGGTGRFVERPETSPRIDRLAVPAYPDEARRAGVRARARVRVLVNADGEVASTEVVERTLIDRRGREQSVGAFPYGMEEAVGEAARRCRFRAGRDGGLAVRAYATIVIQIGTDG